MGGEKRNMAGKLLSSQSGRMDAFGGEEAKERKLLLKKNVVASEKIFPGKEND